MKNWKTPDVRGWAIIGFFCITFFLLEMIRENPSLLQTSSFMQFAQALATGGILLVATNLFGGTKSGAELNSALATSVATGTGNGALPAGGTSTTNSATVTSTTTVAEPDK